MAFAIEKLLVYQQSIDSADRACDLQLSILLLDAVIDRLYLLRKIELGIAQADADDVVEHEAYTDDFEAEDGQ